MHIRIWGVHVEGSGRPSAALVSHPHCTIAANWRGTAADDAKARLLAWLAAIAIASTREDNAPSAAGFRRGYHESAKYFWSTPSGRSRGLGAERKLFDWLLKAPTWLYQLDKSLLSKASDCRHRMPHRWLVDTVYNDDLEVGDMTPWSV